ncbi:RloB family protein [Capnocytophaga sp.]|uniref:RloB family protein n=1 Tax=Capnocytophaga sp. TaxID=44737 RepID=UPI0026DBB8AD|nr:RloB family protein [Capnocytophaga sp.]MDO5106086.1 RloB family protein [Capnocytophaga sp.]
MKRKNSKSPSLKRPRATKIVGKTFLIVCEGKNTEPNYFNHFRKPTITIKTQGTGCNTISLVKEAEKYSKQESYDEVWCVFDKDDFLDNNFNQAIVNAETKNFKVAYSNESFEYWFILHFEDHQGGAMSRKHYNRKINGYINPLGAVYDGDGDKKVSEAFFNLLKERVKFAIDRASRNHQRHINDGRTPAQSNSSTTIYKLVEEILKH